MAVQEFAAPSPVPDHEGRTFWAGSARSLPHGMSPGILDTPGIEGRDGLDPYIERMRTKTRSRIGAAVSIGVLVWCAMQER